MLGMQEAKKRKLLCHFYEIMICVESLRHRSLQRHLDDITCPINNEPKVLCMYMCLIKGVSLAFFFFILLHKDYISWCFELVVQCQKYDFHQKKLMELQIVHVKKSAQSFLAPSEFIHTLDTYLGLIPFKI